MPNTPKSALAVPTMLGNSPLPHATPETWEQIRFVSCVRALFHARLVFLILGFLILAIPAWSNYFGVTGPLARAAYVVMLCYSVANYLVINHPRFGRTATYVTLCFDLIAVLALVAQPKDVGPLQNPLLAIQLVVTMMFAIFFPTPLAIIPSSLALVLATYIQLSLKNGAITPLDILTLLCYVALNFVVYVLFHLNEKASRSHRQNLELRANPKSAAAVEERARIARDIHDGLGASLSSLIIQSEYLLQLAKEPTLVSEIRELRTSAEESMEQLRRNVKMLREDFDLRHDLRDYTAAFAEKTRLGISFQEIGLPATLPRDTESALFGVLQEILSNCARHAEPKQIEVKLLYGDGKVLLSVHDDGKGFDARNLRRGHYGLQSMRERARELGGDLLIETTPGVGSVISFSAPVSAQPGIR